MLEVEEYNRDHSVEEVLGRVIDRLCAEERNELWKVDGEKGDNGKNEVSSCSTTNITCGNSRCYVGSEPEKLNKNDAHGDSDRTARKLRMGVGAFLQAFRLEDSLTRKRNRPKTALEEKDFSTTQSANVIGNDIDKEVLSKIARPQFSNLKVVFREKELFASVPIDYGFKMENSCNNYIKSCKWSTSCNYLATTSQDRTARIFYFDAERVKLNIKSSVGLGDLIYDSCWHPNNDWLVTTSKDHPIHIWNSNGQRHATFRGINNLDELDSAYSLCFASDGSTLYGGYKNIIRRFDINRPGQQIFEMKTWTKESKGQKGIISCIAINPVLPSNYAVGSYGKTVGFYSDYSRGVECLFECQLTAVTLIQYTPDGNFLLTAGRKDDDIVCWDLRYPGKIYALYRRPSTTNQRIYFDIDKSGAYLYSGSSSGDLYVFDLKYNNGDEAITPCAQLSAHRSALCGVSICKNGDFLATCSGQRVFPFPELDTDNLDLSSYENIISPELLDNSLAIWHF